ncbi:hypothetical protein BU23DRAFT_248972 [Bimuria novae-zelandiae CBS 107.79]|uniref:Uncharacterized protein n=1 Tax=Bimuria novae-zelandiae CBS 107.79 TaxID=1447943 RepID=A0A6A5VJY7_9PLEO|nr:hypothetical protein BU23DRAFT_248972 [Bimuria novae-zelandiae CBS 107.79]
MPNKQKKNKAKKNTRKQQMAAPGQPASQQAPLPHGGQPLTKKQRKAMARQEREAQQANAQQRGQPKLSKGKQKWLAKQAKKAEQEKEAQGQGEGKTGQKRKVHELSDEEVAQESVQQNKKPMLDADHYGNMKLEEGDMAECSDTTKQAGDEVATSQPEPEPEPEPESAKHDHAAAPDAIPGPSTSTSTASDQGLPPALNPTDNGLDVLAATVGIARPAPGARPFVQIMIPLFPSKEELAKIKCMLAVVFESDKFTGATKGSDSIGG